jgi:hypothetical protein
MEFEVAFVVETPYGTKARAIVEIMKRPFLIDR